MPDLYFYGTFNWNGPAPAQHKENGPAPAQKTNWLVTVYPT